MGLYKPYGIQSEATTRLLGKVLGLTGAGFVVTSVGCWYGRNLSYHTAVIVLLANLLTLFAVQVYRSQVGQVALFFIFTAIEGAGLGPTMLHYTKTLGPAQVETAAVLTGFGMLFAGIVAYLFSINYRKLTGIGLALLLALIGFELLQLIFRSPIITPHALDWATLAIFSIITVADFARIRAGGDSRTAVELAIAIYLDGLNIFLAVLGLKSKD